MEKTSKIKSVEMLEEWSGNHGTFYPHKVLFENGDIAIANKKTQNAYTVGETLKYEITGQDPAGNNKFKEVKDDFVPGKRSKGSNASFALSYAKDLVVADKVKIENILPIAEKLNNWLNEH